MARKFLTALDLAKNELQNAVVQNLASAPGSPVKGQLYFDTSTNTLYWWNGTAWVAASPGTGFPGYGSITAETTFGGTSADGVATTVARSDHKHANPLHDNAAHSTIPPNALAVATANTNMGGFNITNTGTPVASTDAANKFYVDNVVAGLSWKEAVRAATTTNGTLASAFANGSVIDGVTLATGNRILLKNQTTQTENGIYTVNASGAPTRATDADTSGELDGAAVFVMEGTTLADTGWVMTANAPITIGSTNLTWSQFSGAGASVPLTRLINTTAPLTGGGDLSVDRTLAISNFTTAAAGAVPAPGTATGKYLSDSGAWATLPGTGVSRMAGTVAAAVATIINHNFNTRNVVVNVYRTASPYDNVECDIEHTDVNNVTVRFAVAPAAAEYTVVVVG